MERIILNSLFTLFAVAVGLMLILGIIEMVISFISLASSVIPFILSPLS